MTDVYSFEDTGNILSMQEAQKRRVASDVMNAYDFDAEDTARAQDLARLTGGSPGVIALDTKGFESQLQRVTGSRIVTSSDVLRDFVARNPMNARVAQDDWDNLSEYEQALKKIGYVGKPELGIAGSWSNYPYEAVGRAFRRGWSQAFETSQGPFITGEGGQPGLIPAIEAIGKEAWEKQGPLHALPWYTGANLLWIANRFVRELSAIPNGVYEASIEWLLEKGMHPYEAKRLAKEFAAVAQWRMEDVAHLPMSFVGGTPKSHKFAERIKGTWWLEPVDPRMTMSQRFQEMSPEAQRIMAPVIESNRLMKPYIEAGVDPPAGLHPIIDEMLKEQTKSDLDALNEVQSAADKTNLKVRSPLALNDLTKGAVGERSVYVDIDALHALYAGKVPTADDGILGWVPGINKAMQDNLLDGERIAIPMEQWITNTTPEVRQALKNDIAIRAGDNTLNDWGTIKAPAPKPMEELWNENSDSTRLWDSVTAERRAAKLEPFGMRMEKPQRLQVQRAKPVPYPELVGEHSFAVTDEIGRHVADLEIDIREGGRDLHVVWFGGRYVPHQMAEPTQNIFGPTLIRDLFRQLRAEFPEAKTISGRRISGAREGTLAEGGEVKVDLDALRMELEDPAIIGPEAAKLIDVAESGEWINVTDRVAFKYTLRSDLSVSHQKIFDDINAIWDRILPKDIRGRAFATKHVLSDGSPMYGIYQPFLDRMPVILASVSMEMPGVAYHEAIHHLRAYGFIRSNEWQTLRDTAISEGWINKHKISERYPSLGLGGRLEEAVAEEFRIWAERKPTTPYSGVFNRIAELFKQIRDYLREVVFGKEPTVQSIFSKIERGEVGERPMGNVLHPYYDPRTTRVAGPIPSPMAMAGPTPKAPFLPKIIPQAERPIYEPGALMPAARQRRYEKLIEEQRTEDKRLQEKAATAEVKKQANEEWRAALAAKHPVIEEQVANSPPFAIDRFFRYGELGPDKLDRLPKLNPEHIHPDYLKEIPKEFLSKKGESPDLLAGLFGLASGEELLNHIAEFRLARGELGPKAFFEKAVGIRLQREMEKEFGTRGDMIKRQAEDHVYNDGQFALLHEDTLAMAARLGQELSFTKADVARQMNLRMNTLLMKDADFKNTTRALYRAGGKLEDALLKGDGIEAFKQAQRKELAFAMALAVKQLEKEKSAHDRVAKAYRKRIPTGRDQKFTPFVHDVLERMGETSRPRTDIDREMAANPKEFSSLAKLDEWFQKEHELRIVPEFLLDPTWRKDSREMTVEEWRGANDFITILDKFSREESRFITEHMNLEFRDLIDNKMVPQIQREAPRLIAPERALIDRHPSAVNRLFKSYYAQSLQIETVFNWFDRNHPRGIFNQALVREYTGAANRADALDREFGGLIDKLPRIKNPHRLIKQKIFRNPDTGEFLDMRRTHILAILQNMGNPGNFFGVIDGYKVPREMASDVAQLVWDNVTREDVIRAIEIGKIFKRAKEGSDRMYRQLVGVAPMNIDLWSIQTPFRDLGQNGLIEGWYHPLVYDMNFRQTSEKLAGPSPLEFPVWTRSNLPAAGYTKERTRYKGPILLEFDSFQGRLDMIIRDQVWRPTLVSMQKVFKDPEFRSAIREHWGPHYEALLDPFLKDIAGHKEMLDYNMGFGMKSLQFIRQNLISHMVGLNPSTIAKHAVTAAVQSITEVGVKDFSRALFTILGRNAETGERNWTFAMNKSEELQRRHRFYVETISGRFERVFGHLKTAGDMKDYLETFTTEGTTQTARLALTNFKGRYLSLRDWMHYIEAWPMAFLDLLSAVPTWLARYRQAKMAGENEGNAIFMSDRAVRRAHGSSAITSRTQFQRQNAIAALFANFYAFFSHILQRQIETTWAVRAALRKDGYYVRQPEIAGDGTVIPPELEVAKKDRHVAEETAGEYQKTDDFKYGMQLAAPIAGMIVAYYIFPAWWDEIVAPQHGEKGVGPDRHESWLGYATKTQIKGLGGSWLFARDFVHAAIHGGDVSSGLFGEGWKYMMGISRSISKQNKQGLLTLEQKQSRIRNFNGIINTATGVGLPNAMARVGIFGHNWYYRRERPKSVREWWTGITKGTVHPKH